VGLLRAFKVMADIMEKNRGERDSVLRQLKAQQEAIRNERENSSA
jgi:hypothetical protein